MQAKIEAVRYIACPECGARGWSIDHLKVGQRFGPWTCGRLECGAAIAGTVTAGGAEIEIVPEEKRQPRLALLKLRDLYFVLEDKYGVEQPDYFYHSHQCPTNLLSRVIAVYDAEGEDPHGIMRYVADLPWSAKLREEVRGAGALEVLFAYFKTNGQPAPSKWPEENRGVLPFIAEAQRGHQKKRSPKA